MTKRQENELNELAGKLNKLEDLALEWKAEATLKGNRRGQMTRELSKSEMLDVCARMVLEVINA